MDEHQGSAPCIPVWKTGVYLSTLMLDEMESRAGCSANGIFSNFDDKGWVEARMRFGRVTARVCDDESAAESEIGTMVNVTVNPQWRATFRDE